MRGRVDQSRARGAARGIAPPEYEIRDLADQEPILGRGEMHLPGQFPCIPKARGKVEGT